MDSLSKSEEFKRVHQVWVKQVDDGETNMKNEMPKFIFCTLIKKHTTSTNFLNPVVVKEKEEVKQDSNFEFSTSFLNSESGNEYDPTLDLPKPIDPRLMGWPAELPTVPPLRIPNLMNPSTAPPKYGHSYEF